MLPKNNKNSDSAVLGLDLKRNLKEDINVHYNNITIRFTSPLSIKTYFACSMCCKTKVSLCDFMQNRICSWCKNNFCWSCIQRLPIQWWRSLGCSRNSIAYLKLSPRYCLFFEILNFQHSYNVQMAHNNYQSFLTLLIKNKRRKPHCLGTLMFHQSGMIEIE